jgi:hypothetical protein
MKGIKAGESGEGSNPNKNDGDDNGIVFVEESLDVDCALLPVDISFKGKEQEEFPDHSKDPACQPRMDKWDKERL